MGWNAFEGAKSSDVEHAEGLPEACEDEVSINGQRFVCKTVHLALGGSSRPNHGCFTLSDDGRPVEVSWE